MTALGDPGAVPWKQRGDDLSWREIDEEVIVLDLRSATYLRFNPSGSLLWNLLEPGASAVELAKALADKFGLDADQAEADVTAFLQSCADKGLIERQQP